MIVRLVIVTITVSYSYSSAVTVKKLKAFCCRRNVCFSLCSDKTCVGDVFLRARLIRTPDNTDTRYAPFLSVQLIGFHCVMREIY